MPVMTTLMSTLAAVEPSAFTKLMLRQHGATAAARETDDLYMWLFWFCVAWFVLLMSMMVFFVVRYGRRKGRIAPMSSAHNTPLEVTWTLIPTAMVIYIFWMGFDGYMKKIVSPGDAIEMRLTGFKWSWKVEYPNGAETNVLTTLGAREIPVFYMPAERAVRFRMNSTDVMHSFWVPDFRVKAGTVEIGALTALMTYVMQILMSVMMGTFMLMMVPRSAVCADRVGEVLDTRSTVEPPLDPVRDVALRGHLELDAVGFTYPGAEHPVLEDVSLRAGPGQTVAIIGSNGAGKTTLVNLVPRLFDATAGSVRVDGVDVRHLDPELLWSRIGLVPQRAFLFTGTVADNLRHGRRDASDDELWHALEVAQARDFVEQLPGGLDAAIAQGGTNVSGGQRQRLAIARALVRRPDIYLFDDAFSALDLATDARLRAALKPETRQSTVLVVAQRVSTIRDADLILVLEGGRVVGRGTHAELLADNPTYQEIVASQLSAEEAA